jgi:hypothetical protein
VSQNIKKMIFCYMGGVNGKLTCLIRDCLLCDTNYMQPKEYSQWYICTIQEVGRDSISKIIDIVAYSSPRSISGAFNQMPPDRRTHAEETRSSGFGE